MKEPFSALGVAAFSLASYADGNVWQSGLLAGLAVSWLWHIGFDYLERSHQP